jgi:hypothetical protein
MASGEVSGEACGEVSGEAAELDRLRAENERLKHALAGHLFDGESVSTREAIRTELIGMLGERSTEVDRLRAALAGAVVLPERCSHPFMHVRGEWVRCEKPDGHAGGHSGTAPPAEVVCERCKRSPVWHPGAPDFDGRFCAGCIDRCHEATEFDHTCPVCASGVPTPTPEPGPEDTAELVPWEFTKLIEVPGGIAAVPADTSPERCGPHCRAPRLCLQPEHGRSSPIEPQPGDTVRVSPSEQYDAVVDENGWYFGQEVVEDRNWQVEVVSRKEQQA